MRKLLVLSILTITLILGCKTETYFEKPVEKAEVSLEIKPGTRLTYGFNMQGQPEEMDIFLEEIEPDVKMKWNIPSRSSEPYYRILTSAALDSSIDENPDFYGGNDTLEAAFSIIFPSNLYSSLQNTDTCSFRPLNKNQTELTHLVKIGEESIPIEVDGVIIDVNAIHARERIWKNYEYWILQNPDFPIILKRISTFEFTLKKIETP